MTIGNWLDLAVPHLQDAGIESARLDALLLLSDALGTDKAYILAHPEHEIPRDVLMLLAEQLERRDQHEPLAYIRGFCEFYGRQFRVTPDVLVPRPESESMIDLLKANMANGDVIADIGTGTGCLAITAALETGALVYAVDIDKACLAIAEQNAVLHTASVAFLQGSLLEPLANHQVDVIVANLPYVPSEYPINEAAKHEPALALFAGDDGLDLYRQLFVQAERVSPRLIITEALLNQHDSLIKLAAEHGYSMKTSNGLAQLFKAN